MTTNLSNYDKYMGSISYFVGDEKVTYTKRTSGRWQPDVNKIFLKNLIIKAWYILIQKMNGYLRNLWIHQEEIQSQWMCGL